MAAPATPIAVDGTQDKVLKSTTGTVYGIAVRETAGGTAKFILRSGSNSGVKVVPVTLAANQTLVVPFPDGVAFDGGVYEDWTSGAYDGTVWIGDG